MGNYLKVPEGIKSNKKFLNFFRKQKIQSVFECYEYYMKVYFPREMLTEDEFDDIYSSLLNDCQAYYKLLEDKDTHQASFLEAFVALTVFSKGEFDVKIRGIFVAFDQDDSGMIERKELLMLLRDGIQGLCKLVGLPVPQREDITQYAYHVFKEIDEDNSDQIEFQELANWIRESEELQDFLLKYTGQQTFERARKRYRELCQFYTDIFEKNAIDFMGEKFVTMVDLKRELRKTMNHLKPEITDRLFVILDYEDKGAVSELEFQAVMKPWASFSATDINNDNELDSGELKTMIWLVEENEPKEARVQRDLKLIDADGGGTIDRLEYISFLASPDTTGNGREFFDFSLKSKFDQNDKDRDGLLNLDELFNLVKDEFYDEIKNKSEENQQIIKKLLFGLTKEIMHALDSRQEGAVDWQQFKKYNSISNQKSEGIRKFISKHT